MLKQVVKITGASFFVGEYSGIEYQIIPRLVNPLSINDNKYVVVYDIYENGKRGITGGDAVESFEECIRVLSEHIEDMRTWLQNMPLQTLQSELARREDDVDAMMKFCR